MPTIDDAKFPPACGNVPHIIHGGDYNPDQWLDRSDILEEDMRLMKLAGMNSASIAIFAWHALEPREGVYTFDWLDDTIDRLHKNGISVILATPSAARPAWMDAQHPEVLRVGANRVRNLHGERHNHCYTSPYYRSKVTEMNTRLAERYARHPAVSMWHLSNEYGGECHCELCQAAFRDFLREKYNDDIGLLNREWWTSFWSHTFDSFDQIESPAPHGENGIHALHLDWMRFVTRQTTDFIRVEAAAVKAVEPALPTVVNLMGTYVGLDPWKLRDSFDVASWDNYPTWHSDTQTTAELAGDIAFVHDLNRSLKRKPFLLMESTPSQVNWVPVNKLKRPGMHILSSIQAVAHGSDSVQYFQWRKSRGASEKLHGAVVDHVGHENTRVFREVQRLGEVLRGLDGVVGTATDARAAVIYDWENRWAIEHLQGLNDHRDYEETSKAHYRALWRRGISTDIINMEQNFSPYSLIAAPMLYMLRPGVAGRLEQFVQAGGTLVLTYLTGYAGENDLCFQGGFPGDGLMDTAGVWAEEMDPLYPGDRNRIIFGKNSRGLAGEFAAHTLCEVIHARTGCEVLATYGDDFYAGMPAVTRNVRGKGRCYYIAARTDFDLLDALYGSAVEDAGIAAEIALPEGVSMTERVGGGERYRFLMNFSEGAKTVPLEKGCTFKTMSGESVGDQLELAPYDFAVLRVL